MTEDLLSKEKGFRQLNEQLEQKAQALMKRIDSVINTYDGNTLINSTKNYAEKKEYSKSATIQNENNLQMILLERNSSFDQKSRETQKSEDEIFSGMNLANKAILNAFKAKIGILQNELQTLQAEYKKKDLDKLYKEMKVANQQSNNCTMRLNRALENNEKLRNALKCSEIEEKELKVQIRKVQEEKRLTVNNLGKRLSELIQVFKKQMLIVDNLKKQNACLLAIKQLEFTKEDFLRLLEQKPESA